eukprot:TRINITY_DN4025_c0_g1_i3.p1 TRINITY_DN4025_c0_g1~~TRINITY_DN4025_c0_g1_i3.p1  ORF type:complete len:583 (+),score=47.51 TRINITY_DN4025_c0_g1_i3:120-1751(+)
MGIEPGEVLYTLHEYINAQDERASAMIDCKPVDTTYIFLNLNRTKYETAHHKAIRNGDLELLKHLIKAYPRDVKLRNHFGFTALVEALNQTSSQDILNLLKEKDTDRISSYIGGSLLHYAAARGLSNFIRSNYKTLQPMLNSKICGDDMTPIFQAVLENQTKTVKDLLEMGAPVNLQSSNGGTALFLSMFNQNIDITRMLLDNGANPNIANNDGATALYKSMFSHNPDIVKMLLENNANTNIAINDGTTPLHVAVQENDTIAVEYLLKYNASTNIQNVDGETALFTSMGLGIHNGDIVRMLLENDGNPNIRTNNGSTPLLGAVQHNDTIAVEYLLKYNASVNLQNNLGETALSKSMFNHNPDIVRMLLENNADPNITKKGGVTPLHIAVGENDTIAVEYLLKYHANTNMQDDVGATPLFKSMYIQNEDIVRMLLENNADPDIAANGFVPLHAAVQQNDEVAVEYLLLHNANPNVKIGITPLNYACVYSLNAKIVEYLAKKTDLTLKDETGYSANEVCCTECPTSSMSNKISCKEKCQILKQYT